jgi:hypothetical protein
VREVGRNGETANVYLSEDGTTFTFFGTLTVGTGLPPPGGNELSTFALNLDNFSIQTVKAIKIEGGANAPGQTVGFDLVNVTAANLQADQITNGATPEPASLIFWSIGTLAATALYRRRPRQLPARP